MSRASSAAVSLAAPGISPFSEGSALNDDTPGQSGADRRVHKRHPVAEVPFVSKVRLKYGPAVALIDLSRGGAQIETTAFRLQPGSSVVVEMESAEGELSIPAFVIRCQLSSLLPEPIYRGSLAFKKEVDFKALAPERVVAEPVKELDPTAEAAHLRQVLRRLDLSVTNADSARGLTPMFVALSAAVATTETPAGRRSGAALANELAVLFKAVGEAIEKNPTPALLASAIEEHLRFVVAARAIRVGDADMLVTGSETLLLAVPSLNEATPPAHLAVEFADGYESQDLHLQILNAGIQLIAVSHELGRLNGEGTPLRIRAIQKLPAGWSRVVVCYTNGQLRKGFTQKFLYTKGFIQLMPDPAAPVDQRIEVPFGGLKAIFFVKNHDGDPNHVETKTLDAAVAGRKVCVTFADGEELVGTTLNYNSSAGGFFVQPADPTSNNERVFVIATTMKGMKFL